LKETLNTRSIESEMEVANGISKRPKKRKVGDTTLRLAGTKWENIAQRLGFADGSKAFGIGSGRGRTRDHALGEVDYYNSRRGQKPLKKKTKIQTKRSERGKRRDSVP